MQIEQNKITGLYTGQSIVELLDQEIYRVRRYERSLSVVLFQLDILPEEEKSGFTDLFHEVCANIKAQVRTVDLVGEYGDKVLLVLPETNSKGAKNLTNKLKKIIEKPSIKLRVGIATVPKDGETRGELLESARKALN